MSIKQITDELSTLVQHKDLVYLGKLLMKAHCEKGGHVATQACIQEALEFMAYCEMIRMPAFFKEWEREGDHDYQINN